MLQARIEELGSAILNLKGDIIYIDGFYNCDRLMDYLNGINCIMSKGIYDYQELDYSRIQDNCLFIIKKDNRELKRYQFIPLFKGIVKYKNVTNGNNISRTFTVRHCHFSNQYNLIIFDEDNNKQSLVFNSMQEFRLSFENMFSGYKLYTPKNKRIWEGLDCMLNDEILLF